MKRKRGGKRQTSGNRNAVGTKEEEAFIDFVNRNAQAQIEQDVGFNQFDDENHNGVEFEPEEDPDSNSTSFFVAGDSSVHDESTSLINRTIQKLVNEYGQEKLVTVDSLMKVGNVQSNSVACSGSLNRCQRDSEAPCQDLPNKKELSSALSVIRRIMKMDAAIPFNVPVDPTALRLHVGVAIGWNQDYFDVIHTPMDFGTIRRHLENGNKYMNSEDVLKDVQCIWKNCYKYYDKGNYILDLMERVKESFIKFWTAAGLFTEEPRITHDLKNPCAQKRKGRGPTRNLRLAAMSEGEKFDITWRNRRPVGANSTIFKAECTILVRQTHDIPLQVKGWMEIPFDIKKKLFEHMLERFNVEDKMKWVLSQIRRSYNNYRYHLKGTWYDTCETIEEARANAPPNVTEDDWQYLVNLWSSSAWQERSKKNKENCAKSVLVNKFGSKSFQQWHEDVREKTGREPSPTVLWEITHAWADGKAATQSSQGDLSKPKRLSTRVCEGTSQMSEREIFAPQHPGQVHDRGNCATPKKLRGTSSSTVYEIKNQHLESEQQCEEHEQFNVAEVQSLKEQVSRIEVLSRGDDGTSRKFQDSSSSTVNRLKEQLLVSEQRRNESEQHNAADVCSLRERVSQFDVPSYRNGATPRKFQHSSSTVNRLKEQLLVSEQRYKESEQHNAAEVLSLRERVGQVDVPSYRDGATTRKFRDSSLSSVNRLKEQLLVSEQRRKESEQHNAAEVCSLRERVNQVDVPSYKDGATPRKLRDSSSTVHQLKEQLLVSEQQLKESEQHNAAEVWSLRERVRQFEVPSYGDAATPKRLRGSSSTVNELKKQLLETEQRREESEKRSASEVQSLKEQVSRVEGLLSEQMNRFEGLMAQMMSQMPSPAQVECRTADPPSRGSRRRGRR